MNRQQERVLLAVLGLVLAGLVMIAGARVLSSGNQADVAAGGEASSVEGPGAEAEDEAVDPTELLPQDASPSSSTPSSAITVTGSTSTTSTTVATTSTTTTTSPSTTTTEATTTSEETTTTVEETTSSSEASSTSEETTTTESTGEETTTSEETTTTVEETTTTTVASTDLSALEQEIVRLTNQLRANPSGELRRRAPLPECVDDDFYSISVDDETGHPTPVPALSENRDVSLQMARDWSQQMAAADAMTHRSQDSQRAIYSALGINWSSFGENVAWAQGYAESSIAFQFFSGWRESNTGHYCSMMSGRFTHIGVGHHRTDAGKDWGTQNFYSLR